MAEPARPSRVAETTAQVENATAQVTEQVQEATAQVAGQARREAYLLPALRAGLIE